MKKIFVVIPSWNGADMIRNCLDSLAKQSINHSVVVVDNGSVDESTSIIETAYPDVKLIKLPYNTGFAGGVNRGITYALGQEAEAIALLNNDAVADQDWLKNMVTTMAANPKTGIVACKILSADKTHIDSTGDYYTSWGLPYPRGRDELVADEDEVSVEIFGASGGASLYRAETLRQIGLFDEDFFAYYEDVDISFRAQLAGWKVLLAPLAKVYHDHGTTSSRVSGFTTYQTFKNYPQLFWKNVPLGLMPTMLPRFTLAYLSILVSSLLSGKAWPAVKGLAVSCILIPKTLVKRWRIQHHRQVPVSYIRSILVYDLPPNAAKLRKLRCIVRGR